MERLPADCSEVPKYMGGRTSGPWDKPYRGGCRVIVPQAPNMTLPCPAIGVRRSILRKANASIFACLTTLSMLILPNRALMTR